MEPFPGEKVKRKKRVKVTEMLEIICTCQSTDGGYVVECEVCKHQECLRVPQSIWENKPQHDGCVILQEKVETMNVAGMKVI